VRELKNTLERAVVFCEGNEITADHLALSATAPDVAGSTGHGRKTRKALNLTQAEVEAVLLENEGNVRQAAAALDVSVRALYYHLRKIGRNPNDFRKNPYRRPVNGGSA
jgi:DNA-binding NtrC family response regulator